jgi:hypothetical protein
MKKTIVFIVFLAGIAMKSLMAQSQLTIFHQDGERFWVIIDGIKQNAQPQASVFLPDVKQEFLRVKIIFENEKIKDIDRSIQTKDVDGNFTHSKYIIRRDKNKTVMRIHSYEVIIPQSSQPVTDPRQTVVNPGTTERPVTTTTTTEQKGETISIGTQVTDPETGQPVGFDMTIKIPSGEKDIFGVTTTTKTPEGDMSSQTQISTSQTVTYRESNTNVLPQEKPQTYQMPGYNGKIGCPWPMSEQDFADAKRSISSKSFEDSKMTIAKQITTSNCLLCSQIREIMNLFSFESTKLDFAKYAYDYVYDLNNYYKLNDAFTFESSIDDLNEYINRKKR